MHGLQGDGPAGDPLSDDGQAVPDSAGLLRQPQPQLSQRRSILVLNAHQRSMRNGRHLATRKLVDYEIRRDDIILRSLWLCGCMDGPLYRVERLRWWGSKQSAAILSLVCNLTSISFTSCALTEECKKHRVVFQ